MREVAEEDFTVTGIGTPVVLGPGLFTSDPLVPRSAQRLGLCYIIRTGNQTAA